MNTRNCECCRHEYATGKNYGDYNSEMFSPLVETKGLCEFCNPNVQNKWFTPNLTCHNKNVVPLNEPCPKHEFVESVGECRNCGAIKEVYEYWKNQGKNYKGHNFVENL